MINFRQPSLIKPIDTFVSFDPAFIQPPTRKDDASDEDVEQYKKDVAEYVARLNAARKTGDWAPMLAPGKALTDATKFTLLQVDGNIWRELLDRAMLPGDSPLKLGDVSLRAVLVRLALKSVSGLETKIERAQDPRWGYVMAQPEIIDIFDKETPRIVGELGNFIIDRLRGVDPL